MNTIKVPAAETLMSHYPEMFVWGYSIAWYGWKYLLWIEVAFCHQTLTIVLFGFELCIGQVMKPRVSFEPMETPSVGLHDRN